MLYCLEVKMMNSTIKQEIIEGECPYCSQTCKFTSKYSMVKCLGKTMGSWLIYGRKEIVKDLGGVLVGQVAKNYQCLSCNEIVHVCPSCNQILKYFNTGKCSNCNTYIA